MGTLVIKCYPAFFSRDKVMDHAYVECGTGLRAWSCWGGKAGGNAIAVGAGSTRRANRIARPDERANIRCYAINGVCHQAANRIAFPAGLLALGARGYGLSEAVFGPYGRPHGPLGLCAASFDKHTGVTGDLEQCAERDEGAVVKQPAATSLPTPAEHKRYIDRVLEIYDKALGPAVAGLTLDDAQRTELGVRLFLNKAQFNLGGEADRHQRMLEEIYRDFDRRRSDREDAFLHREINASQFAVELNQRALDFQHKVAGSVRKEHYRALMDLEPDQFVMLVDPSLVEQAYR